MFEIGIIILIVGCILKIYLKLTAKHSVQSLAPQRLSERNNALHMIQESRRVRVADANVLILVGSFLVLIFGVFN